MKHHIIGKFTALARGLGAAALACGIVAASASAAAQAAPAVPTIKPGVMTIGIDLTWPPYDHIVDGKPAGFDVDFMEKVAQQLGLKPVFEDTRFANLVLGLMGHRFDVVASALYITAERAKQIDYVPYLKTGGSLITLQDSSYRPQKPEELCGKRVASLKGAAWVPVLDQLSRSHCAAQGKGAIQVQEFASSPLAAQALLARSADVQFDDAAVSQMMVRQSGGRLAVTSTEILYPVVIGLGVPKGNPAMLQALSGALDAMKADGSYAALLEAYSVEEPSAAEVAAAYGK